VEALRRARPAPAVATNPPRDDAMLKDKLREVEGLFAEAQNVIVRLEKERGTSMSELSRLRQVLDSTAADRASVEEEVAKLRARVALSQQAGSDGMDPRHRLKELEDALRVARHDLGESIKENTQLKARLATSPGTEDTHFGPLREALGRAERAEGHLASLRDALEDATTKLGSLPAIEGENRRLAQALAAQQEAKVQQDLEIARHRDTITGQQQQIAVLTREVDRLRMEKGAPYVTRSGDVAAPRANNGAADEDLRLALRNAKAEVERLRADVSDLARRLDQAEGAKRSALADAAAHKETAEAQKHIAAQAVKDHKVEPFLHHNLGQSASALVHPRRAMEETDADCPCIFMCAGACDEDG
jgi:DNA repair exonuclease SbcCD ATPase subunit